MLCPAEDEEPGVSGKVEGIPLLPLSTASAPAPILQDTQISIGESEDAENAALIRPGPSQPNTARDAAVASDDRKSLEESEEIERAVSSEQDAASDAPVAHNATRTPDYDPWAGCRFPREWWTEGLMATVDPENNSEILRLRGRVDTRLHEAARAQDLAALRALLAAGAAPAALDWAGRTPLHACVVDRLIEPLKELLRVPGSANVCDASCWPLLHATLLHGWQDGARAVLDAGASVDRICDYIEEFSLHGLNLVFNQYQYPNVEATKMLYSFSQLAIEIAMEHDMEMFEAILAVSARYGVLESTNTMGMTALYAAIEKRNLPAVKALLKKGASAHKVSEDNITALHVAIHDPIILKYLLDNTDVTSSLGEGGQSPLHRAVCSNNPESVRLLLDKFNNAWELSQTGNNSLHYAAFKASNEAAEVILEKDVRGVNTANEQGDTPLHAAAKRKNKVLAELLLRNGAKLSTKDKSGVTALEWITIKFDDIKNFFDVVFDTFIYSKKFVDDFEVHVDYQVLSHSKDMSQINVLEQFIECGRSKVLIHPLIESLLYLKWKQFRWIFYTMIIICFFYLILFNSLMVCIFYIEDMNRMKETINTTISATTTTISATGTISTFETSPMSGGEPARFQGGAYWALVVLTYISMLLLLLQESCFIYLKGCGYFSSVESWVKLIGLLLSAVAPLLAALAQGPWPRHVACAALLLAWLQAMFLVSRFPRWGYYVLMFGKVIVNMLKILVTAIFLVIGFSLCFMIQYRAATPFEDPFSAIVKTLVMMSSEFEYENLFGEEQNEQLQNTRTIVQLMFVIFVIFVAIVLMNFMIGVAVSDINDLNETGNIRRLEKQMELLSTFDALVYNSVLSNLFKNTHSHQRYHKSMSTSRGKQSTWIVKCRGYPDPNKKEQDDNAKKVKYLQYSIEIPSELANAIAETANKSEQAKRYNADKIYKRKIDALYDAIIDRPVTTYEKDEGTKRKPRFRDLISDKQDAMERNRIEDKRKEKDLTWLRTVITKQNDHIKSLVDDLLKISHENKETRLSIEDLNSKISQLSSDINEILSAKVQVPGSND